MTGRRDGSAPRRVLGRVRSGRSSRASSFGCSSPPSLGGALGYERERSGKAAGLRTHMLVAIGAALFVLVPQQGGMVVGDMSRVIQGIVTGVGFLGAGAIIKHRVRAERAGPDDGRRRLDDGGHRHRLRARTRGRRPCSAPCSR